MDVEDNSIHIAISKTKLVLAFFGAVAFVILGAFFCTMPTVFKSSIYPFITIEFIFILGIVSVLLFSFFVILILKRIFQQKAGLILSEKGIFDNSSATFADLDLVDEYLKSKGK